MDSDGGSIRVGVPVSWFEACFDALPDPRTGNAKQHDLLELLTIALTASICGAQSCSDFADFAVDSEDLFREFLDLENGVPSHDTFSRVFRLLDPDAFATCFTRFVDHLGEVGTDMVAIDAKTLRRSFDAAAGRSPLEAVTAFSPETGTVIGHKSFRSGEGGSEIEAARQLLRCLDLRGTLVSGDAIHCQQETAQSVLDQGGDYLFAVKDNWPVLHREIAEAFTHQAPVSLDFRETSDNGHGRVEVRRHWVSHEVDWLTAGRREAGMSEPPPGVHAVAMVESEVTRKAGTSRQRRYYVCSAAISAQRFADAVRRHWAIENTLHWVLDETFDEDKARNRTDNGPENLTILRKLALNVLQRSRRNISIRRKRKRCGWSNQFARSILGQVR